jgi:hypothetical protein|tara:strand:- start:20637 stop:20858 length:222 start_codon:yes stop_codon:yes gene_type:complete
MAKTLHGKTSYEKIAILDTLAEKTWYIKSSFDKSHESNHGETCYEKVLIFEFHSEKTWYIKSFFDKWRKSYTV